MNDQWQGRYRTVRAGFWWRIKVGDGDLLHGRFYTQTEAERMCAMLLTAFRDGMYVAQPRGLTLAGGDVQAAMLGRLMHEQRANRSGYRWW